VQIARFRYTRNDTASVPAQAVAAQAYLASLLASDSAPHAVGVMMTDTYGAAAEFIKEIRVWQHAVDEQQTTLKKAERLTITFSNVSFVGPNSLASRLVESGTYATAAGPKAFAEGVMVSQVVPNYESDTSDLVAEYLRLLGSTPPSFTSLEGYVTGLIFLEGLRAHKGAFTPDALVDTFERLPNLSLGLGASSGFSPNNHNYSKSVWGTLITAEGKFANRYYWSGDNSLQLSE
jgi:branched-chain amino acid transport system substrate-binding protein